MAAPIFSLASSYWMPPLMAKHDRARLREKAWFHAPEFMPRMRAWLVKVWVHRLCFSTTVAAREGRLRVFGDFK